MKITYHSKAYSNFPSHDKAKAQKALEELYPGIKVRSVPFGFQIEDDNEALIKKVKEEMEKKGFVGFVQ